ncbi:protein kinase domain-containing protein [Mycobacterium gastri]|uniref:Protein kinase domain-containing protein n=1 Tax=Mycobacterium gastri TaxID=1777 RepID=A0A1X1VSW8_MYCGS|nr:protein kinase [Mycobacterium gastri]ETW22359.1 hypothetical protein MGAST_20600 [Mycobacterium gastri 'Wayne']ORV72125.1 hypothetical protein AWC07_03945 [Mycobacterium gastri]
MLDLDPTQPRVAVDWVTELGGAGFVDAAEIGRGGFGVVFRCLQVGLDRPVAVKVLTGLSDEARTRFSREQQAMARLTGHPNIVAVLQVGQTAGGWPFLVMPLCGQGSWQQRIAEFGVLSVDEVLEVGVKIAGALAAAHRVGVVHRDVNPANVLFTDYGEPALTDFGVAHINRGCQVTAGVHATTPAFAAPEVIGGASPGADADVYGLGASLFAALTGHAAFERRQGEQVVAQFVRISNEPHSDRREHDIPTEVDAIIAAAMAPDPADRPSAAELGEQLRHVLFHDRGGGVGPARPIATSAMAARPRVGNLPMLPAEVVGRGADVAELRMLLATSRLVTLAGMGGVGKTTLALHAAAELRAEYPDGVWLVDLSDLRDGTLLTETVAAALGVRDHPGQTLSEVLVDVLAERDALLVLDNCEHLIDDAAKFADTVLHRCSRLHVLATSREVLDIAAETVKTVSPLGVPRPDTTPDVERLAAYPGVALFLRRACAAVPDFTLNEYNGAAVHRICTRLEGLPLAIELAAARLRAMSVEQIADGLSEPYTLLTRGHRGAPSRQKTLAGCIDWSYQLCTRTEQRLWATLAVFAGTFDLPAAHHLCADELPAEALLLDLLGVLVDKSILIRIPQRDHVRFRFLETLRDFAKAHVTRSEQDLLRARHAHWYHQLVTQANSQWFTHGQLHWSERLLREMPNVREALQFSLVHDPTTALEIAVAMRPVWQKDGMFGEARRWLESALDAVSVEPSPWRVRALSEIAVIAFFQMDLAAVRAIAAEARDQIAAMNDIEQAELAELRARFDAIDGYIAVQTGEIERGVEYLRRAQALTGEFEVRFAATYYLGWAFELSGDLDEAMNSFEAALAITTSHGESWYRSRALVALGVVQWLRGELHSAELAIIEGLELSQLIGDPFTGAQCFENLAWIAGSHDDWRHAGTMLAAADALSRAIGSPLMHVPDQFSHHEQCCSRARQELGRERFEATWAYGAALNFDEAVALALDNSSGRYARPAVAVPP